MSAQPPLLGLFAADQLTPACTCVVADCFSVIPESAETKRRLPTEARETGLRIDDYGSFGQAASESQGSYLHPTKPEWVDAYGRTLARRVGGVDVLAAAGAAVILNNVRALSPVSSRL